MKKIYKVSLAAMTLLTLVACGPKRRPRTQPSTVQSEVTDGKSSKKASSGHEYYQTVLERYQAYSRAIEAGDSAGLETKLKEIDPQSDEYVYAMYLQTLGSKPNLSYFYTDLDKDGRDELLIGNGQTVSAIYYLKGQQPELLHTAFVASSGGSRSSFQIFEDGSVIYASFSSLQPEVDLIHYKFQKGKLETVNKIQIKNGDGQKPEKALGITAKELDQAKFGWKELETGKKAISQASTSEQQTNSYQVRVAVSDLRIRKEASIKGEEVGMIPQGVYTITETVTADGYTWGKLQSGQGWIALEFTTRVEGGNASTVKGLSAEDQEDIHSVVENGYSLMYSRLVKPTFILDLSNDHSGIYSYTEGMFLDYFNTYTPGTYQLADVIKKLEAQETSESIQSMTTDQLIQLAKERKQGWIYSSKDKKFFEFVPGGRGGAGPEVVIPSADEWVVENDTVTVTTRVKTSSQPFERYVLKRSKKDYSGGEHKTRFYVVSKENVWNGK